MEQLLSSEPLDPFTQAFICWFIFCLGMFCIAAAKDINEKENDE